MKRSTPSHAAAAKRFRSVDTKVDVSRLCDLHNASSIFFDEHAAKLAKERGILRSRVATEKYHDLERQLLEILQEGHGIEAIDEQELRETLPSELEADTAGALISQVVRHQRYEEAARHIALEAITQAQSEHEKAVQQLKLEHEVELTRVKVSADVRSTADVDAVNDQLQCTRDEYDDKMAALEARVAALTEKLEEAEVKQEETESDARERLQEMDDTLGEMQERVIRAEAETDLKREASRKLKEEVIGNDRLTVANLNRIKTLESQLQEQLETIEQLEQQNDELRAHGEASDVEELKELLEEREKQLMQLSHKLEVREAMAEMHNNSGRIDSRDAARDSQGKRQSLLDRIGQASSFSTSLI